VERQKQILAQCAVTAGNTMRSVAGVAWIAPARGRASQTITNIMHTGAARLLWKPKWPWVKAKPPQPATTGRAGCNARFLLREVRVSGALSGARTGKGPQMANPRPTPKPGNLGPPWTLPARRDNPAGYSRGRRISDAIERLIEERHSTANSARRRGAWSADRDHPSSAEIRCQFIFPRNPVSRVIRCRFIIFARKDEPTPDYAER